MRGHLIRRPRRDDAPAVLTGAGAEIDDVVGGAHHRLVVLDDEHGVAEIAQARERADQPLVVDRVEADGGLVADVEHPHQGRPDLRREPDALPFAAGERGGGAVEREVLEPDVAQEGETPPDLLEDLARDLALARSQGRPLSPQALDPVRGVGDREGRDVGDRPAVDGDGPHLGAQAGAAAVRARHGDHVALDVGADPVRLGLPVAPLQVGEDPLPADLVAVLVPSPRPVLDGDALLAGAVHEQAPLLRREVGERRVEVEAVHRPERLDAAAVPAERGRQALERDEAALRDRERAVRRDQLLVDLHLDPESGAGRAGSVRAVEGEVAGLDLAHGVGRMVGAGAREVLREGLLGAALGREDEHPLAQRERLLRRVGDALAEFVATLALGLGDDDAVDDDVDVVPLVAVECWRLVDLVHLAVDADPDEPGAAHVVEHLPVLAPLVADHGAEHERARSGRLREDRVDDLLHRLAADHLPAVRAVRDAGAREEQAQVVVDLGDRGDGRSRVARDAPLVDRDGGRESLDVVDVRLLHEAQELPRVCRERLHVAALALRVDRVERERGLAGAGDPREHDQAIAGDLHRDVAQVVLARAGDDDLIEARPGSAVRHRCRLLAGPGAIPGRRRLHLHLGRLST